MSNEKSYFDNGNVNVTDKRLVVNNKTYAISGITSVSFEVIKQNRLLPIALLLATVLLISKQAANVWGYLLATPFIIWLLIQKSSYTVRLSSASGETRAITSKNKDFIKSVVDSINKAMIDNNK